MNKLFFILLALPVISLAQDDEPTETYDYSNKVAGFESATKKATVYVVNFNKAQQQVNNFIQSLNAEVNSSTNSTSLLTLRFSIKLSMLNALDSFINTLGYVTQNNFSTNNIKARIRESEEKINELNFSIRLLNEELADTTLKTSDIIASRGRLRNFKTSLNKEEANLNKLKYQSVSEQLCRVELVIKDEESSPSGSKVSFVNMPGFEYNFLLIENPKPGVSASTYQGYNIKYMFTRGKSFFNLGVYKADNNIMSDSLLNSDLFMLQFGQDFYPRHFGRGKRKYFNLYTGYLVGGFIATNNKDQSSGFVPNANVALGVELLKTKHILIDNKVSYFLPLSDLNRNLRGINYGVSLNFVF